ncbi:MAG: hypothetical protein H6Q13_2051 [Bacteroidetes bacterium]|jgi:hypothetical protein|nr:hypothetical protein [Bacteroidota bacterium]
MKANFNRTIATSILFVACLLFTVETYSQSVESKATSEQRAKKMTDKMKEALSLTDAQYQPIYEINLKYAKTNEQLKNSDDSKMTKFRNFKTTQEAKAKEMKAVLTSDQYKEYEKLADEIKAQLKEGYKNRKK